VLGSVLERSKAIISQYAPHALRNEAQAVEPDVKDEQRVHSQGDPAFNDTAPAEDTDACRQRPQSQYRVDRNADDVVNSKSGQERGDDEREESVPDDAHGLEEGAEMYVSTPQLDEAVDAAYMLPPRSLI